MPFGTYETPKPTPVPTFLQYLKTVGKGVENKTKFAVDIIWLPGKFDNVTLQTHAFRYICDSDHPLYADIRSYFSGEVPRDNDTQLQIVITSIPERTIEVLVTSKIKGSWEKLGSNAMKFKPI